MRGRKRVMEMGIELLLLLNYIFCKLDTWLRVQLTTFPRPRLCLSHIKNMSEANLLTIM